MFKGSFVALVTPHLADGAIDEKRFRELVEFQIESGTHGIVPCGCTGEAATLSHEEQKRLIKITVDAVRKRVPVIAGTGSNNTREAVELTKYAKKAGADGALLITPYYNKPTPEGQYRHYMAVAEAADIPIVLYNVPSRTGVYMLPDTVARLSKADNIVAIKEASGSMEQVSRILSLCDITVLSGDDSLALPMMVLGAKGVISVAANVMPDKMAEITDLALNGNTVAAKKLHFDMLPLFKALFMETNPIPVKTALSLMGKIEANWRLPLCEMSPQNLTKFKDVLSQLDLI